VSANYYVLLGDVVLSRDVAHREEFQKELQRACMRASEQYRPSLHADIKLIKGVDEIGAVLNNWRDAFDIVNLILDAVHPYQIRFALVRDLIDVGETSGDVSTMDGPAFHRAAAIINELKQSGLRFRIGVGEPIIDLALSNQVSMLLLLRQRWTVKHHQVVAAARRHATQRTIAEQMQVSQQEVSRLLRQINWKQYQLMEKSIRDQFRLLGKGDV